MMKSMKIFTAIIMIAMASMVGSAGAVPADAPPNLLPAPGPWVRIAAPLRSQPMPRGAPEWLTLGARAWSVEIARGDAGAGAWIAGGAGEGVALSILLQAGEGCDAGPNSAASTQTWSACEGRLIRRGAAGQLGYAQLPQICFGWDDNQSNYARFRLNGPFIETQYFQNGSLIEGCNKSYLYISRKEYENRKNNINNNQKIQ